MKMRPKEFHYVVVMLYNGFSKGKKRDANPLFA